MALHVEHITKAFGEKTAVDDLSFSMEHSGVFGLIGTNGAGKTTTIRIILGIMKSDAGRAEWDGRPIVRENVRFGYMPEERGIYMKEKVFEQLVYFGMLHRMTKADASAAARRWLERLGITEYADYFAEKLSKGNQQKVQLIVTLLHDPELIILDEPFSGLDPVNTELFRSVIRELVEEGRYIVMSSHQMATVEEYCENLLILNRGKTILKGNLREIKSGYGRTRLAVNTSPETAAAAAALGLEPVEIRADYTDYKISSDASAEAFLRRLLESGVYPTRYEIKEPSLHEIFLDRVGGTEEDAKR